MIEIGKTARRQRNIYALTRPQTEHIIVELFGPKARQPRLLQTTASSHLRNALIHCINLLEKDIDI